MGYYDDPVAQGESWTTQIQNPVLYGGSQTAGAGQQSSTPAQASTAPAAAPATAAPAGSDINSWVDQNYGGTYWQKTGQSADYWKQRMGEDNGAHDRDYWKMRMETANYNPAGESGGGGQTAASSSYAPVAVAGTAGAAARGPQWDAFYQQLLGRSTQSLDVNANDPVIRNQVDAYRAEQTRNSRESMAALAERGGPNTNLAAETRAAGEAVGQATSAQQAKLIGDEVTARRAEIAQALTLQQGQLSTEEASRLKQEDQALAKRQQDIQQSQFGAEFGLAAHGQDIQKSQFDASFGRDSQQQDWMQAFQDRGWTADQAQRAWDDQYKTLFG